MTDTIENFIFSVRMRRKTQIAFRRQCLRIPAEIAPSDQVTAPTKYRIVIESWTCKAILRLGRPTVLLLTIVTSQFRRAVPDGVRGRAVRLTDCCVGLRGSRGSRGPLSPIPLVDGIREFLDFADRSPEFIPFVGNALLLDRNVFDPKAWPTLLTNSSIVTGLPPARLTVSFQ